MTAMQRTVTSHLDLTLTGPSKLVFSVAAAAGVPLASEELTLVADGERVEPTELVDAQGSRLHVLRTAASRVTLDYRAVADGQAPPPPVDELDLITYVRPSRYCESDTLGPTAAGELAGLHEGELLTAVADWVAGHLTYAAGSSLPTDGAARTLLGRQGVCRDFAHLSIALLRALNVPARLAAVFAPGLSPMEYHAVCEAYVDGAWYVVDATHLAPRQSLLRVATGRDAADTAFLTNLGGTVELTGLEVTATVDELPVDDGRPLRQLV
ncbi:Transglutaminase-like superfamily protein [Friedmanniella luteola]|uniref:Transglutaminase-like superfamily protein n=2 Tax=Friedmanniella luteola TaxID=546871 RepID=A0A1H1M3T7_9ACTN|nr:Transglutaminase-like superfamily protein [Friedmanniella luteola]